MSFRMAGGIGRLLKQAGAYALPRSAGEAALRFGPDLAFAGLYAANVPQEYASGLERAGLFAEDVVSQTLPGVIGSALVGVGARRLGMKYGAARSLAGTTDMIASMTVPMAARSMNLLPVQRTLDERAAKNAELQRQMEAQGIFEQGLVAGAQGFANDSALRGIDLALANLYG